MAIFLGSSFADLLLGTLEADTFFGGDGDDIYIINDAGDVASENPNAGADAAYVYIQAYTLDDNVETLLGLWTGQGNMFLSGNAGDNTIIVGSGASGQSFVDAGAGNDVIYSVNGTIATGGEGNDTFVLLEAGTFSAGGTGDDVYIVNEDSASLLEGAGGGVDTVYAVGLSYVLQDNIETLALVSNNLSIPQNGTGNALANTLIGNSAANILSGREGGDFLVAGGGNDVLIGGEGLDVLQGNAGSDSFVWTAVAELGDVIQDWVGGEDTLVFDAVAFGFTPGVALIEGVNFISGNDPLATSNQPTILWDADDTNLYYDADGSGSASAVLVADLQEFTHVDSDDILLAVVTPPVFTSAQSSVVLENQGLAYVASVANADMRLPITYEVSGEDADRFTINPETGETNFRALPDYENPADSDGDNIFNFVVTARDAVSSSSQDVSVTIRDTNDNPTRFTSDGNVNLSENQTLAYVPTVLDADTVGATLSFGFFGADAGLMEIDALTGAVSFLSAPDFERPADSDQDNIYDFVIFVSDGANIEYQAVNVAVTDMNDNATQFTSPTSVDVMENHLLAYTPTVLDADMTGAALIFDLSGTDAEFFSIDRATGVVSFISPPDFETPADEDGDNIYEFFISVFDGENLNVSEVSIHLRDDPEYLSLFRVSELDGSNGFSITGIRGLSLSSEGDIDGDGLDDIVIGDGSGGGEAYILYSEYLTQDNNQSVILTGIDESEGLHVSGSVTTFSEYWYTTRFPVYHVVYRQAYHFDYLGRSISNSGDINGDGFSDILISAPGSGNGGFVGRVEAIYGGEPTLNDDRQGFEVSAESSSGKIGVSVSIIGDFNGDGYDDFVITQTSYPGENEAYLVFGVDDQIDFILGSSGAPLGLHFVDTSGLFDDPSSTNSTVHVSSAGDVNGDGYDDIIMSGSGQDDAGVSYIVFGGPTLLTDNEVVDLSQLNADTGFSINGLDEDDGAYVVSSVGDVNGDGYDDLLIGSPGGDPIWSGGQLKGDNTGESYVVFGGAEIGSVDLASLDGSNGFRVQGIAQSDRSGSAVGAAGDINGDGYDDFIISSTGAHFGRGEVYVIFGTSEIQENGILLLEGLEGPRGFTITSLDAQTNISSSVSGAGDINGDGFDDIVVNSSLTTYVIYGGSTNTESFLAVSEIGTSEVDNFTGNAGDDTFVNIDANDVVRGGAGDDTISVTSLSFADIRGGNGRDALSLDGTGMTLDLTIASANGLDSIEIIDISGSGNNTLILDALAVFQLTEERFEGLATLDVRGDSGDSVTLQGSFASGGSVTDDGVTYTVYTDGNAVVRVETSVSVTTPAASQNAPLSKDDDGLVLSSAASPMASYDAFFDGQLGADFMPETCDPWEQDATSGDVDPYEGVAATDISVLQAFTDVTVDDFAFM